jgi:hypothetical protein
VYLTNEVFLYRVVGLVGGPNDVIELEDCYALDVVRVPMNDLRERCLRLVTPSPIDGRGEADAIAVPPSSAASETHPFAFPRSLVS